MCAFLDQTAGAGLLLVVPIHTTETAAKLSAILVDALCNRNNLTETSYSGKDSRCSGAEDLLNSGSCEESKAKRK